MTQCGGDRFERLPLSAALLEADVPLADTS